MVLADLSPTSLCLAEFGSLLFRLKAIQFFHPRQATFATFDHHLAISWNKTEKIGDMILKVYTLYCLLYMCILSLESNHCLPL